MATVTNTVRLDDLNGAEGAETVVFGYEGVNYEIDLAGENLDNFRAVMDKMVGSATKVSGKTPRKSSGSKTSSDASKVREWARANGHEVGERGRIPSEVREAYAAAHPQG